ncbi:alpha/beta hydrolase [Flavobacterium sp.]|uniref:alpha/beta fold hydrolase n=1 Tax=Flavobacterium sp. TaxID=239 RepID=UPI00286E8DAA|nr:alpha/beta hydrolase [Flavobacterium sp.]
MKKIFFLIIAIISLNSSAQKLHENGRYVEANGVKLFYEVYGEGEPLLMIHGNGGSFACFENQVAEFSKHFKVVLVDCRGRGNSSYQKGIELSFDLQVEDINLFLDKLNIKKTNILGWSDGGIIGLLLAIKQPEKVNKLVASGANIFPDGALHQEELKKWITDLEQNNKNHENDLAIDLNNLDFKYPNLKYSDLNVIKSKTLIVAGDHDEIKGEHTLKIYESIPNAQLAILPNSSHSALIENSILFNEIVLRFLMQ